LLQICFVTLAIAAGLYYLADLVEEYKVVTSKIAHLSLLSSFPFFNATSPSFIVAVVMVIVNHYFAFSHFGENYYQFSEVMAYFLFVSLSANENVLPTLGESRHIVIEDNDVVSNYFSRKQKGYGLLSIFNFMRDSVNPNKNQHKSY